MQFIYITRGGARQGGARLTRIEPSSPGWDPLSQGLDPAKNNRKKHQ